MKLRYESIAILCAALIAVGCSASKRRDAGAETPVNRTKATSQTEGESTRIATKKSNRSSWSAPRVRRPHTHLDSGDGRCRCGDFLVEDEWQASKGPVRGSRLQVVRREPVGDIQVSTTDWPEDVVPAWDLVTPLVDVDPFAGPSYGTRPSVVHVHQDWGTGRCRCGMFSSDGSWTAYPPSDWNRKFGSPKKQWKRFRKGKWDWGWDWGWNIP